MTSNTPAQDELMHTVAEAAERIGLARTTTADLVRAGRIRSVNLGTEDRRIIRIPDAAVLEFIATHAAEKAANRKAAAAGRRAPGLPAEQWEPLAESLQKARAAVTSAKEAGDKDREEKAQANLDHIVLQVNTAGATWTQIASALGQARQTVHRRYGKKVQPS